MRDAAARLRAAGMPDPAREARLLLRWASGLDAARLLSADAAEMDRDEAARFAEGVERRLSGAPLSHVLGRRAFWGRDFFVTADVLDPRPETEILVAWALEGSPPARILDLGVGSGCILLSLLAEWPTVRGEGVDASPAALAVAARNAETLGVADRVALRLGHWLDGLSAPADLIVANPPYLDAADMAAIPAELRAEPRLALDGGADGLDAYRAILSRLDAALAPGGAALLEIGAGQAEAVAALARGAGWPEPALRRDLDGRPRTLRLAR
ncbi:MAG: peptide chain release factor N(5)-glutamine methyltransferase [Rubrimonas sp.]